MSDRVAGGANVSVLDGSPRLWVVPWPADGSVNDYIAKFKYAIGKRLQVGDVYLIFDRYYDYSAKSVGRGTRETWVNRVHHLQFNSKLPAQKILIASSKNKKQLMQLIVKDLVRDKKFREDNTRHAMLSHEEADNIIVQQVLSCAAENEQNVVVADDTSLYCCYIIITWQFSMVLY